MGKFYGVVGYGKSQETSPGVWSDVITEYPYRGDVMKDTKRLEGSSSVNDNLSISDIISIVADAFAYNNFYAIKYVVWMGTPWKVTNVDANQRPRLILTLGGKYNGPRPKT
jgi:hypothetical protein